MIKSTADIYFVSFLSLCCIAFAINFIQVNLLGEMRIKINPACACIMCVVITVLYHHVHVCVLMCTCLVVLLYFLCVHSCCILCTRFTQSFNRTNLQYSVVAKKPKKVTQDIIELINRSFRGQSGIVYCLSR